jgi:arylsulfatase A-like enzyme
MYLMMGDIIRPSSVNGTWDWKVRIRQIDRGFQYFKGYLGDMMDDYWTHRRHGINYMMENRKEIDPEGHATDLFSRWAVDYIHEQKRSDKPFMLYLAYNAPHFPVQPPDDWLQKVKKDNLSFQKKEPGWSHLLSIWMMELDKCFMP